MIDFPLTDLMDEAACQEWLQAHLHPDGLVCPQCGSDERRVFRQQQHFPAYRCRRCDGYYTLLTNTIFEKTHQPASTLLLLLRGVTKGESTAQLSRELAMSYKQVLTLRQRLQTNAYESLPNDVMDGAAFEADELYQNAGEKKQAAS